MKTKIDTRVNAKVKTSRTNKSDDMNSINYKSVVNSK